MQSKAELYRDIAALLDNKERIEKEREEISKAIGIGALKYNDLSQNRQSDIAFDWDKMLSFEGNSGPYLQYSYTRLRSILNKAGKFGGLKEEALESEADLDLVLKLAEFPEVIQTVTENYFPHYLAGYLHTLFSLLAKDRVHLYVDHEYEASLVYCGALQNQFVFPVDH